MQDVALRSSSSSSAAPTGVASPAAGKRTLSEQLPSQPPAIVGRATIKRDCCLRVAAGVDAALVPSKPDWVAKGAVLDVYGVTGSWLQVRHADQPAYVTGASSFVSYAPLPPPPVAPAAPTEEPGLVDQLSSAVHSGVDKLAELGRAALALFGSTPSEPTAEETRQLHSEPIEPATGKPTDPAAIPPGDIAPTKTKQFSQMGWYGADGAELDAKTVVPHCVEILNKYDILECYISSGRGEVYNDQVLKLPIDKRPSTVTARHKLHDETGAVKKDNKNKPMYSAIVSEAVPDDVMNLPQLMFIPGSASCLRTAEAMASGSGATAEEGSGVATSHIQMVLASDQQARLNADGKPLATNNELAGSGLQARDTKSTEQITADAGADHVAQIKANVKLACDYMDAELAAGRSLVIGVSYTNRDGNNDGVTDHWMCVYAKQGGVYKYFDPGNRGDAGKGDLQVNPDRGGILEGHNAGRTYALAQVRLNTQSSEGPSPGDIAQTMKQVAADANAKLAKTADAPA